ncbi:cytochrome P450 [Pseudonocardia eucalypti]|uniref:Cytochrome P450 n=1 Tax=Pseudonocardia eucalypti TaxID=648755 RepID=A0ABP9PMV3_9PSEU
MPGSAGPPIIGHTAQLLTNPPRFYMDRYRRYGPVSRFTLVGHPSALAVGGDAAKAVLGGRDRFFASGRAWSLWGGPFFARGLLMLDFEEHLAHRALMEQAFTRDRIGGYLDQLYTVLAEDLADWKPSPWFRAQSAVRATMLRASVRVFMGGGLGAEAAEIERAFLRCVAAAGATLRFEYPGGTWSRGMAGRRRLEELFADRTPVVRARGGSDLFAVLSRATGRDGQGFSDEDVVNHMVFLMFAAFDPVSINLVTMIRYLAEHPAWQERCREESFTLRTDRPGAAELGRLAALELVMKESLRLLPPVYALPNTAVEDADVLGYEIPAGTVTVVSPFVNHRLPEYWSDPDAFDPERFAPHRREDQSHEYAWIPFGGGVHKCIGLHYGTLQMKAVMHQVLRRYRWRLAEGHAPEVLWRGFARMRDGLPIELARV